MKLDADTLKKIGLFQNITRATVKDCFELNEVMYFIVGENEARKAVGKKKANLIKLERLFNRKIKIVEFNPDRVRFIANICFPAQIKDITEDGDLITIEGEDSKSKGLIIGVRAKNLRAMEEIARKWFPVKEIKVI